MIPPWFYAAGVALALGASFAMGASWKDGTWGKKYAELERDHAVALASAVERVREEERNAKTVSRAVASQPVTMRVLCRTESVASGVSGAGGAESGDSVPVSGDERDIAARLREVLVTDTYNREIVNGLRAK